MDNDVDNDRDVEAQEGFGEGYGGFSVSSPERSYEAKDGKRVNAFLSWKDLKLTVDGKRYILQGLSGCAEPGRLTAIMGPSGSGKSTLLDTLAGRQTREATVTGDILVNGHKANLSYGSAAYLAQDVTLLGTLTVYETLYYSAKFRFKDNVSESETKRLVMIAIEEVGLVDCMNTVIGNWFRRGISGGEKRRVSIAIELLTSPTLIFLDEPTSGLDSASSFHVIQTLKGLARDGERTILCSIHQPSSEVFDIFDDLCLLSDGQQVYFGPLPGAQKFFEGCGFPCPPGRSASDHYLHCVNSDFDIVERTLRKQGSVTGSGRYAMPKAPTGRTAKQTVSMLVQAYRKSEQKRNLGSNIDSILKTDEGFFKDKGSHASFLKQTMYLTMRSFLNMHRDVGYYWGRVIMYVVLSICLGTIFSDVGHSYNSIQARAAAFIFMACFLSFMAIGGFPSFIEDMKVYHTERMNGHYRVASFVIANTLSSMPFILLISGAATAILYPLAKFQGGFVHILYFLLALYGCLLVSEAMMMAVSSMVTQFLLGIMLGAGLQGIFILVNGYFRLADDLPNPVWKYPLYYMSYVAYAFQGLVQNEMAGLEFEPIKPGDPPVTGRYATYVLYQVKHRSKWVNLAIVFGMFIGYRILFFTLLTARENFFPTMSSKINKGWVNLRAKVPKLKPSLLSRTSPDSSPANQQIVVAQ